MMTSPTSSPTSRAFRAKRASCALVACGIALLGGSFTFAQEVPVVRPASEVFGPSTGFMRAPEADQPFSVPLHDRGESSSVSPFSILEPDWQPAGGKSPARVTPVPTLPIDAPSAPGLLRVQSLQLPELAPPVVETAVADVDSPLPEPVPEPVRIDTVELEPEQPPAFAPRPIPTAQPASGSEDLEGMLHNMVWVTATIGLAAVASLWLLRMWLMRGGRVVVPSKSLKLVDTLRIGPRCGVYLVETENQRVLVGVEHGKTMCVVPLPSAFRDSLDAIDDEAGPEVPAGAFERVADVFTARRSREDSQKASDRSKGSAS
jgi:flagellar biogenesis protein FliO